MFPFTGPARRVNAAARKFAASLPGGFSLDGKQRVLVQDRQVAVLRNGQHTLNLDFALPDGFSQATGLVATVFVRDGDDFIRITTSVRKQDGQRAIGTPLDRSQPAYNDLLQGRAHLGYATIFGKQYLTRYEPVHDASGRVIGILFVGLDITASPGMGLSAAMAWRVSTVYAVVQAIFLGLGGHA